MSCPYYQLLLTNSLINSQPHCDGLKIQISPQSYWHLADLLLGPLSAGMHMSVKKTAWGGGFGHSPSWITHMTTQAWYLSPNSRGDLVLDSRACHIQSLSLAQQALHGSNQPRRASWPHCACVWPLSPLSSYKVSWAFQIHTMFLWRIFKHE